jgi:16S rRNA G966 N2-methylase RsmD
MIGKLKSWLSSLSDRRQDRRLGVQTEGLIVPDDIASKTGCFAYLPLGYRNLERIFSTIEVRAGHDVFIDYGSGLGRVPLVAAQRPFKRVIGVELSKELHEQAKRNAHAALPKLACRDVEVVCADAREYPIPPDATIVYFFMPFDEPILGSVLDKLKASVDAHPRDVSIVYVKPTTGASFIESVAKTRPWLELTEPRLLSSAISCTRGRVRAAH